jgi:hypothetical protein
LPGRQCWSEQPDSVNLRHDQWDVAWNRAARDVGLAAGTVYRIIVERLLEAWCVGGEID